LCNTVLASMRIEDLALLGALVGVGVLALLLIFFLL
jgi:hypothetical protein